MNTEEEVLEYTKALLQMYREQGHYLERIYKWAKRIGVDVIKDTIMNQPDARASYVQRFEESQHIAQVDPWAARVKGEHQHEFNVLPMKSVRVVA